MTPHSKLFLTKNRCMRTSCTGTTLPLRKLTAKLSWTEIASPTLKRRSASRNRTPLLRKTLASTIPRRNTLAPIAAMTAAADKTSAAIAVAIAVATADAEDAGGAAAGAAAVEDTRKAAAICPLQNTRLRRGINVRRIPGAALNRAASKVALSSRATIAAQKARGTARLLLR